MYGNHMNRQVECVSAWVLPKVNKKTKKKETTGTQLEKLVIVNGKGTNSREAITEQEFLASGEDNLAVVSTSPDEMAFWLYSSGTTGRPKGIVHLQHDMAYTVASYADNILKLTPDDICYSVPKIFFASVSYTHLTLPTIYSV